MRLARSLQFIAICSALALPATGRGQQVFHGDGAVNDGAGGWTTSAGSGYCLASHGAGGSASNETAYLLTGHKNMLKKVTPGAPWTFSDGSPLRTLDTPAAGSLYDSGSVFDWIAGKITVGPGGAQPGTQQDLFYVFGGWVDPSQLNTAFRDGFTGEQWPSGDYDCGRCHAAGYRFDDSGPEPTYLGSKISGPDFMRVPTDYDPATGPQSSWTQDGVTCERCHVADNGTTNHVALGGASIGTGVPSKPTGTAATELCMECHRTEIADTVANTITFDTGQFVQDGGVCSDGTSPDYATCIGIPGNTWGYAPFLDHPAGLSFLNSPHARFTGSVNLNAQNSTDLSLNISGTYGSQFRNADLSQGGCTTCHDPHQSFTQGNAVPLKKNCGDCHPLTQYIFQSIRHPTGPGTPFPTGTAADVPGSCAVCHLTQGFHFFRISTDPSYTTFPTVDAFYAGQTTANTAPEGDFVPAVWNDLDLACGQCHLGSGTIGLVPPPGISVLTKARLAANAVSIHGPDIATITSSGSSAGGSISPLGATAVALGGNQTFSITPNAGYKINYVAVNGVSVGAPTSYTFSNVITDQAIKANFLPITYTITVNQAANGIIAPYTYGGFTQGASQTYSVTPSAGYHVADVSVDGASQGAVGSYTFSGIQANHTITASYAANPSYTIAVTQGANGTISPGTTTVTGGLSQTFSVTPSSGYVVSSVTVDGANVGPVTSYSFYTVSGNHTITASFVNSYVITSSGSTGGSISPLGATTVPAGGSQTYAITPNAGYEINYVAVNGISVGAPTSYSFGNVNANATIKVNFLPITYTITVNQTANGIIAPSTYGGFTQGASQTYSITPSAGYHVADVSVDGVSQGAVGSYTFSGIQANHTITATFGP